MTKPYLFQSEFKAIVCKEIQNIKLVLLEFYAWPRIAIVPV
jgi:hypothetical protein